MNDTGSSELGIAPWLVKRTKGEKCFSIKYTEEQCAELVTIVSFYNSMCWQYEHSGKIYPIFFELAEKSPRFYEEGFCSVTDFTRWQRYLDSTSPFYSALKSIIAYICQAQLAVAERLRQAGHHYDPAMMLLEELKQWAVEFSYVKEVDETWRNKLETRRLFLIEIIGADKLLKNAHEYTDALHKCSLKIYKEMIPCLNALLALRDSTAIFVNFKKTLRATLNELIIFMFHLFRNTEGQVGKCDISELQDFHLRSTWPFGKECESTLSGKLLLKLVETPGMREVFQENQAKNAGHYLPCQNDFVNEEGHVQLPKEWSASSGKSISGASVGFLPVFKNDSELMNQFLYLHALTQKIAMFYVIFQNFSGLTLDCRYVLKEMNEAIQHYKSLHRMWLKNIQGLYEKAESYLVEAKKNQNIKEVENWKYHFSQVRNIYQKLTENIQSLCHLVYDFEKVLCNSESVMPLNEAKAVLEKPLAIMRYFMGSLKPQVSPTSSRESVSFTPPRSAPGSRIGTPK